MNNYSPHGFNHLLHLSSLDELGKGTVNRRTDGLNIFPEVDGGSGAFGDTLRCELKFLSKSLVQNL